MKIPPPRHNLLPYRIYMVANERKGDFHMNDYIEERAVSLATYIIDKKTTVRGAAAVFHISKSTVHKDVTERLRHIDPSLYKKVKTILEVNKAQRHIRGGMATRQKYTEARRSSKPTP